MRVFIPVPLWGLGFSPISVCYTPLKFYSVHHLVKGFHPCTSVGLVPYPLVRPPKFYIRLRYRVKVLHGIFYECLQS